MKNNESLDSIKKQTGMTNTFSTSELLRFAVAHGTIDLQSIADQMEMAEKKKYLESHPYAIWQGKNGLWYTYIPEPNGRKLIKRKEKTEIESVIIHYWRTEDLNPTIEKAFTEWNDIRLEKKKISAATYHRNIQRFDRFFDEKMKRKRIGTVSPAEWQDFFDDVIVAFNLTAKEFSNLKSLVKGFLKRAKRQGYIEFSVQEFLDDLDTSDAAFRKRIIDDQKEVFFDDEVDKIVSYIKENPTIINLGIGLLYVTGLRVGELSTLKTEECADYIIRVRRTETRSFDEETKRYVYGIKEFPKTDAGVRSVVLPRDYRWILDKAVELSGGSEFLFTDEKGKRIRTFAFRKHLYMICEKVGIPKRSPHKLRKTYCSILLDNKVDHKLIEKMVGHVNTDITEAAYHRDRKKMEEKVDILSSIPEFTARKGSSKAVTS